MSEGPPARILLVDDEQQIRRLLSVALARDGYRVEAVASGEEAISHLVATPVDLVLLDLGLPDTDGVDLCREIRAWTSVPVIVVTVRSEDRQKVAALDCGADDYVTKPFSMAELLARIRANLRRTASNAEDGLIRAGALEVDLVRRLVSVAGRHVHLTPTEWDLLRVLASNAGRVVTHRQLLREVRGAAYEEETAILRVHMVALRQKLALTRDQPGYIVTEPGVGYRLLSA